MHFGERSSGDPTGSGVRQAAQNVVFETIIFRRTRKRLLGITVTEGAIDEHYKKNETQRDIALVPVDFINKVKVRPPAPLAARVQDRDDADDEEELDQREANCSMIGGMPS